MEGEDQASWQARALTLAEHAEPHGMDFPEEELASKYGYLTRHSPKDFQDRWNTCSWVSGETFEGFQMRMMEFLQDEEPPPQLTESLREKEPLRV